MFVEYMALQNKKEAQEILDLNAKNKPNESDEMYIVKENSGYVAVLKVKKSKGKSSLQRWSLSLLEKGVKAKREMTKAYFLEWFLTGISALLFGILFAMGFVKLDDKVIFLWLSMVALLVCLLISWRKLFKPFLAMKIFLIRIL